MELIPIIKASLGIFTFLTSVTFIVSFAVYKIKNRNRAKPYERKPVIFDSNLVEVQDRPEETMNKNLFSKKFKILNENASSNQTNKIFLIDSEHDSDKIKASSTEPTNSSPEQKIPKKSSNEVFNIYRLYSNNNSSPMHKIKVKTLTA